MRTICFEKKVSNVLLTKALRPIWPSVVFSGWSPAQIVDLSDAPLPGPKWIRVHNRLCGICGTDLHLFLVEADPRIAAAALPGTLRIYLGHEVVGIVSEAGAGVTDLKIGDRVIMDSRAVVGGTCLSQEITSPCRHCRDGNFQLCENAAAGPGPHGEGGGWGDSYTAHVSEVYRVGDELDDETAAMVEPLSVGVRAALSRLPAPGEQVLVLGCGIVGLNVIQAVRALAPGCSITALARHPQQIAMASQLGADTVVSDEDSYAAAARITNGKLYRGMFNNRTIVGGFDITFDCVGSAHTVQDSLRWTRAGGTVVLVGVSLQSLRVDLSPVWHQEVRLIGIVAHGMEVWNGVRRSTYDLTCDLLRAGKLTTEGLITHRFPLEQWQEAIRTAQDKRTGAIKVVFDYCDNRNTAAQCQAQVAMAVGSRVVQ
ncbi:MAG: zinc-binding dehydrogenase [Caldilineaceae bacterium]